ncbi:Adenine deaminase 2-like protein 1 [Colletotrichum chlorophyti]|uniref:Adenine deaminase 2-like protein 1 n=1 Tax=Colletotrichum chlorophyti TaxID=708187 RepID=A0A1Q8RNG5_9PEZI|nr:Adenine deaminase 2-like protein 1 [Colletotrichum chlorophyti]
MTKIIIKNVRIFDSEDVLQPSNVVITRSEDRIQDPMDDGSAAETSDIVVDGKGCTLIPGLIDVDVNIKGVNAALRTFASHGVTTVIDLSSNTEQNQALRVYAAGKQGLPTVLSCGTEAAPSRDHQPRLYDNPDKTVIRTREEAISYVSSRASGPDQSDFIKVVVDAQSLTDELLKIIVDAAHAHKKMTIARASRKASYHRAMEAGFDIFVHAPLDEPLDAELAREMAAQKKVFVPTLSMLRNRARQAAPIGQVVPTGRGQPTLQRREERQIADGHPTDPGPVSRTTYENAAESVRVAYEAGVTICAGTTANMIPGDQIPFGESLHEELRLLVEAGMAPLDVLRSATCLAAKAFRLQDRGIVRGGLRADLLLIEGNPLEDIAVTRRIRKVWIQGRPLGPETSE